MSGVIYPINDKKYTAEDVEIFNCTRTSGVFSVKDFDCVLNGNTLTVDKGLAWIKNDDFAGKAIAFKEETTLTFEAADGTLDRYDVVAIRYDASKKEPELAIIKGAADENPALPVRKTEPYMYELFLYSVLRKAGESNANFENFTDLRPNEKYCGVMQDSVTSAVAPIYETLYDSGSDSIGLVEGDTFNGNLELFEYFNLYVKTFPRNMSLQALKAEDKYTGEPFYYGFATLSDGVSEDISIRVKIGTNNKISLLQWRAGGNEWKSTTCHILKIEGVSRTPRGYVAVDSIYNPESENAQSGKAVAGAISKISVDKKYNPESENPQSGIAVAEAIEPFDMVVEGGTEVGLNLFNKNADGIITGQYVRYQDGETRENTKYFSSDFIPVEQGKTYSSIGDYSFFGASGVSCVPCYDTEYKYLGYIKGVVVNSENQKATHYTFTIAQTNIPASSVSVDDVAFIKTTYLLSGLEEYMIVEGEEYPTEYQFYGTKITEVYVPFEKVGSPLKDKIVSFLGDSICAGHYVDEAKTETMGGYGKIIAERNGMVYENLGVHGSTIASGTGKNCLCTSVENMRADADYYILEGGVNDAGLDVELGTITTDYTSELDTTTFAGAFEYMLKQAILRFAGKKVGYIFVHKMVQGYLCTNDEPSYYSIAKRCCEKWGVPYIDLNAGSPLSRYVEELKNTYTNNQDGWHPNEDGYKKYYCDPIEAWMKNL